MAIELTEQPNGISLAVKVVPGSSRTRIAGEYDGGLKINVSQPPQDGAANAAMLKLLAKTLGIPAENVQIIGGHASARKHVLIRGLTAQIIRQRLT
jgi:uncharacterized protein (TIGR00251 family)